MLDVTCLIFNTVDVTCKSSTHINYMFNQQYIKLQQYGQYCSLYLYLCMTDTGEDG